MLNILNSNVIKQLCHKERTIHSAVLKGTMHCAQNTQIKLTNHELKEKIKPNKTTTKKFLVPPLGFSPLPLPWQAEPQ